MSIPFSLLLVVVDLLVVSSIYLLVCIWGRMLNNITFFQQIYDTSDNDSLAREMVVMMLIFVNSKPFTKYTTL